MKSISPFKKDGLEHGDQEIADPLPVFLENGALEVEAQIAVTVSTSRDFHVSPQEHVLAKELGQFASQCLGESASYADLPVVDEDCEIGSRPDRPP